MGEGTVSVSHFTFGLLATRSELAAFLQWLTGLFAAHLPEGGMLLAVSCRRTFCDH